MACSALFILDLKGKPIISRNYRGDIDMGVIENFVPLLGDLEEEGQTAPIVDHPEATFIFIKYNNIYSKFLSFCKVEIVIYLFLERNLWIVLKNTRIEI